ncbi:MAG: glycoside hydrolase family 43 protein [Treponema sp.]|jgi:beta-xylosidase|nr:glycoside hydrolase family 43 protein [Treponema sp.]
MIKIQDIQIRDPFILRDGEFLYLFGSTDKDIWRADAVGFDVYVSNGDLATFDGPFPAFRPPAGFWATRNFWASEVHIWQGAFYMFATFKPNEGRRGTAILRSNDPLGPFQPWSAGPVTPPNWECLDGTLFIDRGKPWMVFCHEWQQVGDGEMCLMPLSPDLRWASAPPRLLFHASDAPWTRPLHGRDSGNYVTDGPFVYTAKNGDLLLLWSSFTEAGQYSIGVATSESGNITGPWRHQAEPLYAADGGHGMVFHTADGKLYLAIHTPNKTPNERPIFIELSEQDGVLSVTNNIIA